VCREAEYEGADYGGDVVDEVDHLDDSNVCSLCRTFMFRERFVRKLRTYLKVSERPTAHEFINGWSIE